MAHPLWIELSGACYHVINRCNYRRDLFNENGAAEEFYSDTRRSRHAVPLTDHDAINAILRAAAMNFHTIQGYLWHFWLRLLRQLFSALAVLGFLFCQVAAGACPP